MTRIFTMIAMSVGILVAAQAFAQTSSQSTTSKRLMTAQVVNCMKKRMSAEKAISYNAAAKLCKNQVYDQSNNSASLAVVASDSSRKR